jgi:hypothetical protein
MPGGEQRLFFDLDRSNPKSCCGKLIYDVILLRLRLRLKSRA